MALPLWEHTPNARHHTNRNKPLLSNSRHLISFSVFHVDASHPHLCVCVVSPLLATCPAHHSLLDFTVGTYINHKVPRYLPSQKPTLYLVDTCTFMSAFQTQASITDIMNLLSLLASPSWLEQLKENKRTGCEGGGRIQVSLNRVQWQAVGTRWRTYGIHKTRDISWPFIWVTISFSRKLYSVELF